MGILANSVSVTMVSSSDDDVSSGYVAGEQITLSVVPGGLEYDWGATVPSSSASGRSVLSSQDGASPTFVPDERGVYLLTCVVDRTRFCVLTCTVAAPASASVQDAMSLIPVPASSVPPPAAGATLFFDSSTSALSVKLPDGSVKTIDLTA